MTKRNGYYWAKVSNSPNVSDFPCRVVDDKVVDALLPDWDKYTLEIGRKIKEPTGPRRTIPLGEVCEAVHNEFSDAFVIEVELTIAVRRFVEMRSNTGKPMTLKAGTRLGKKIVRECLSANDAVKMLGLSTEKGWMDIFPESYYKRNPTASMASQANGQDLF